MPKCGFAVRKTYDGQKNFDKFYITQEIVKAVKKVGPNDDDYIIIDKLVEHKENIHDLINSQRDQAGIEAYMKPYINGAEELVVPDAKAMLEQPVQDFSKCPDNLADLVNMAKSANNSFNKLPKDLVKGQSMDEFLSKFSISDLQEYLKSKAQPKAQPKEQPKESVEK